MRSRRGTGAGALALSTSSRAPGSALGVETSQPGAGDERHPVLREAVLARAEEHERAALQPGEEVHDLLDLVGLVADRALAGELRHPRGALEHRREVAKDHPQR